MAQSHHTMDQNLLQELIEITNRRGLEVLTKDFLADEKESRTVLLTISIQLLLRLLRHNLRNVIH